jgi:hypothetical protein
MPRTVLRFVCMVTLIGLKKTDYGHERTRPLSMCMAMKAARNELAQSSAGELCWGAYQHFTWLHQ